MAVPTQPSSSTEALKDNVAVASAALPNEPHDTAGATTDGSLADAPSGSPEAVSPGSSVTATPDASAAEDPEGTAPDSTETAPSPSDEGVTAGPAGEETFSGAVSDDDGSGEADAAVGEPPFWEELPVLHPDIPLAAQEQWLALGGVTFLLLLLLLLLRTSRKKREARRAAAATPEVEPTPALPEPPPRVSLEPSEAERLRREQAEAAHAQAESLAGQRADLERRARESADEAERARIEAERAALKVQEEEAKKEEYRARKEAEKEAKVRREEERQAEERLRVQAEQRAEEAEAERLRREQAAQEAKVRAEAGRTLGQGLGKTREQGFMARLNHLFGSSQEVSEEVLADLEEVLFTADIGVKTASRLVDLAREKARNQELTDASRLKDVIRAEVAKIVRIERPASLTGGGPPHVAMVVGVNGSGKTTSIGKLAARLTSEGKRVVLAAGDTYRAAAAEQLAVWSERSGAELVRRDEGADPGSVLFDAIKKGASEGADVVLADTAGRLHTRAPLMEELKKVRRVMDKALPGAPHEVLLVLDATNGQNALQQAKQFGEAVDVSGIVLTKLDGTAKGGVIIGICDELKVPVLWVGVGEKVEDLRPFDPDEFVEALFDRPAPPAS